MMQNNVIGISLTDSIWNGYVYVDSALDASRIKAFACPYQRINLFC